MRISLFRDRFSCVLLSFLLGIILIIQSTVGKVPQFGVSVAHALPVNKGQIGTTCGNTKQPGANSLLVVVLDRSGSLQATDPDEYSTSVTKILADLWPGYMDVVLMSGGGDALQYLGPEQLSSDGAREHLKSEIEQQRNQLGAFTPLKAALGKAFSLLSDRHFPAGSRVILVTDGEPSTPQDLYGKQQKEDIETSVIPEFCTRGIPINAFGLSINNTTDPIANSLLEEITDNTGGATFEKYQNVTDPASLGKAVITLYAKWQGLTLIPSHPQNGIFSVNIDTYARQAYIVIFHSSDRLLALKGPDHQEVPEAAFKQHSSDTHYEFYNLSGKDFSTSGQYTVDASSDSRASVYELEATRLQVTIVSPTAQTPVYAGQALTVTAAFYDRADPNDHVHPNPGTATIQLDYSLMVNGQVVYKGTEPLNQQPKPNDDLFSNQITPPKVGALTLSVTGVIQDVPIAGASSSRLQVQCALGNFGCYWQQYPTQVLSIAIGVPILLILLILLLLWLMKPSPSGWIRSRRNSRDQVPLSDAHSFMSRLLHKSIINSSQIENHPGAGSSLRFGINTHFQIAFKGDGKTYIRLTKDNSSRISLKRGNQVVQLNKGESELSMGNIIIINGDEKASYEFGG